MLAWYRVKNMLDIPHFCLAKCESRIWYFYLRLFEHSGLHRWLERCIRERVGQGKNAHRRKWCCPFHHRHWWDWSKRRLLCRGYTSFYVGFSILFRDFKACELHLLWQHWQSFSTKMPRQISIRYQYCGISFLVRYGNIYVLVCI